MCQNLPPSVHVWSQFSQKYDRFKPFFSFHTCIPRAIRPIVSQRRIFTRTTRTELNFEIARSQLSRTSAETSLQPARQGWSSELEASLGSVMQTQMGPQRNSGVGESLPHAACPNFRRPTSLRGNSEISPSELHNRQSSSTSTPQPPVSAHRTHPRRCTH
jgi:hypothetical protein